MRAPSAQNIGGAFFDCQPSSCFDHPVGLVLQHAVQPFFGSAQWRIDGEAAIVDAQADAAAVTAAFEGVADFFTGKVDVALFDDRRRRLLT